MLDTSYNRNAEESPVGTFHWKTSEKSAIKFENQLKPNDEIQDHYKWAIDSELQFNHGIFAEN